MKVNHNPRRALGYTVQPQEGGNPRLSAAIRESWIHIEGVDVFNASENGAATEQVKNLNSIPVQRGVEPEEQSPAEHVDETKTLSEKMESRPQIDFVAAPGPTERKAEEKPELHQSEIEPSRSDTEEAWVEDEPPRTGRMRRTPSRKRKTRSLSRKRAKAMSPTRDPIGSHLPKIENIRGDVHLNITLCPVTHVYGAYQAGAAPTVPNVMIVNSNNTCTCAQHVAETDEGSCHLTRVATNIHVSSS